MLKSYGAINFYCFKEGMEISFKAGKVCSNDEPIARVLCVKGANGAGKSNALRVLQFIRFFCCDSFILKPEEEIDVKSFFDNDNPTEFYVDFKIDNVCYHYELMVNKKEVIKESLYRRENRSVRVFAREKNKIDRINEFKELDNMKVRSNASIISTAHQYEISSMNIFYDFFANIFPVIDATPFIYPKNELEAVTKFYYKNKEVFEFTKNFLKKCDLGIKDVSIEKVIDENNNEKYIPFFIHENAGSDHQVPYAYESSGTKSLYRQLFAYKIVLDLGGILVLDEFDVNLHPDILPLLVELFISDDLNNHNAQLLFTTHNSEIINQIGKYRTILVNKDENESFLYRLDELPGDLIRNDRPIEPIYRSGKIGGVPRV